MSFLKTIKSSSVTPFPKAHCGLAASKHIDEPIGVSLDDRALKNNGSTYFYEACGESMSPLIISGDVLVVDHAKRIQSGNICIVNYQGERICKRYVYEQGRPLLRSENPLVNDISLEDDSSVEFLGVVTSTFRELGDL